MAKKIIAIAVMVVMALGIFGLVGCDEVSLAEYKAAGKALIDEHVATKVESDYNAEKWETLLFAAANGKAAVDNASTKTEVDTAISTAKTAIDGVDKMIVSGEFLEAETDEMVDCTLFHYLASRSWIGSPITLNYSDDNAVFECMVDRGSFSYNEQKNAITVEPGNGFWWIPYERSENSENIVIWKNEAYVEIILKEDNHIVGYALVEMYPNGSLGNDFYARLIKSAFFPKQENTYQEITESQVKHIFENLKAGVQVPFVEIEMSEMVELNLLPTSVDVTLYSILLKHTNDNVLFECVADEGSFFTSTGDYINKNAIVISGSKIYWRPLHADTDGKMVRLQIEKAFVDITVKIDGHIVGYAVIEFLQDNGVFHTGYVLKSALFPAVDDKYQTITENQVKFLIENTKTEKGGN